MKVKQVSIDKVIPYHNNPRKNQAIDKVASSINEYGNMKKHEPWFPYFDYLFLYI